LQINFKDKKVRDLCEKRAAAEKKLGANCARKLRSRLSELEAAAQVTDLVAGNPHPLKHDRAGQFALVLAGGWRLVFTPDHDPCPTHPQGGIDWSQVTIVCIEFIGDYHD
jgi:toxin HigB-1